MPTTESSHPPAARTRHTLAAVAHPSFVKDARQFVGRRIEEWGMCAVVDCAVLVTSELVTNAVKKAEGSTIWVAVSWNFGRPLLEVWDPVHDELPVRRDAAPGDEDGRGLQLVESLTDRWGVRRHPTGGKVTWAVL